MVHLFAPLMPESIYALQSQLCEAVLARPQLRASALRQAPCAAPPLSFLHTPVSGAAVLLPPQQLAAAVAPAAAAAAPAARLPNFVPAAAYSSKEKEPLADTLRRAGKRALGGGIPGAAAMGVQVRR